MKFLPATSQVVKQCKVHIHVDAYTRKNIASVNYKQTCSFKPWCGANVISDGWRPAAVDDRQVVNQPT